MDRHRRDCGRFQASADVVLNSQQEFNLTVVKRLWSRDSSLRSDRRVPEVWNVLHVVAIGRITRKGSEVDSINNCRTTVCRRWVENFPKDKRDGFVWEESASAGVVSEDFCLDWWRFYAHQSAFVTRPVLVVVAIPRSESEEASDCEDRRSGHGEEKRKRGVCGATDQFMCMRIRGGGGAWIGKVVRQTGANAEEV